MHVQIEPEIDGSAQRHVLHGCCHIQRLPPHFLILLHNRHLLLQPNCCRVFLDESGRLKRCAGGIPSAAPSCRSPQPEPMQPLPSAPHPMPFDTSSTLPGKFRRGGKWRLFNYVPLSRSLPYGTSRHACPAVGSDASTESSRRLKRLLFKNPTPSRHVASRSPDPVH